MTGAEMVLDGATQMVHQIPVPATADEREAVYQAAVVAVLEIDLLIARLRSAEVAS